MVLRTAALGSTRRWPIWDRGSMKCSRQVGKEAGHPCTPGTRIRCYIFCKVPLTKIFSLGHCSEVSMVVAVWCPPGVVTNVTVAPVSCLVSG